MHHQPYQVYAIYSSYFALEDLSHHLASSTMEEVQKMMKKRVTREEEEEERERVNNKKNKIISNNNLIKGEEGPTQEEVDEFFAILRRMKVAVKYFDDKGRGGKEWREVLETADLTVDHGQDVAAGQLPHDYEPKKANAEEEIFNGGFDLNAAAPEAADIGGA